MQQQGRSWLQPWSNWHTPLPCQFEMVRPWVSSCSSHWIPPTYILHCPAQKWSYGMASILFQVISGQFFCGRTVNMIPTIPGMVSSAVNSWFPWVYHVVAHLLSHAHHVLINMKAFKYIFTSPSSVEQTAKATCSRNARIHSMTKVNIVSLMYIAMSSLHSPPPGRWNPVDIQRRSGGIIM